MFLIYFFVQYVKEALRSLVQNSSVIVLLEANSSPAAAITYEVAYMKRQAAR